MTTFLIFLFILGTLIIVHEFGHFIIAKKIGIKVESFSLGFGPQLLKKKKNDTEYLLSAIPLGGYVKLAGDNLEEYKGRPYEYLAKPVGKRFWVIFCGPLLNYLLGLIVFCFIFFAGSPTLTTKVGGLIKGLGAEGSGLEVGDKIIAVDGKPVVHWEDLQRAIQSKKTGSKATILLLRNNQQYTFEVDIKAKHIDDALGQKRKVSLLGIAPYDEVVYVRHGLFEAIGLGINKTWDLTVLTYKALWRMLSLKLSIKEATGPLGIFFITSKVAQQGLIAVLNLIGIISISLSLFNLLPLPILDGGHILLLAIEKVRGRYLSLKAERLITRIGFSFIITLAVIVTYNDILRLFGDKLHKFFR